jgi:thiosulfate dehydrogenase
MPKRLAKLIVVFITVVMLVTLAISNAVEAQQEAKHPATPNDEQMMVVKLCDGVTSKALPGVKPDARLSSEQAQAVSNELMAMWLAKQPAATRVAWLREVAQTEQKPKTTSKPRSAKSKQQVEVQSNDFSLRDQQIWQEELKREIEYGNKIFHDDKLIGSTNGVACAMCHPNAANTHPETYPKYQVQLQRVAMLRDMINWCIENPSLGKQLDANDPKMRALEAYIMAQRKGVAMEYGKH